KNLGIEELYYQTLSGGVSFVNFSIGMFAGLYVPLLFTQKTPRYSVANDEISSIIDVDPQQGFAGAEVLGEVSVYGYKLQLFDPISHIYNFMTPFGDIPLWDFSYSYPLGSLSKIEDIYSIDLIAQVDALFEIGIYLEANVSTAFAGDVVTGGINTYIFDEPTDTANPTDTVTASAGEGDFVTSTTNVTLQFNNLYFRVKSLNLSVVGSIDTIIASDPSIDISYEVVGEGALFEPFTFPVLNDLLFPIPIKTDELQTMSIVDGVNPAITDVSDTELGGTGYRVSVTASDNNAVWDIVADVEYEDTSIQSYTLDHISGNLYQFDLNIPDGETVDITITTRDIAGREDVELYQITNPVDVPEFNKMIPFLMGVTLPIIVVLVIIQRRRKRNI
ncbi:MAG: hypothetical protein H7641_05580, partial [Candidatus Heimdallarchaeota archaeon]|nr:hypothetical protein [Candidatus Heimdallarchaeota archaeon]MCK4877033.1 hypothetical protein [Candidatus Heimdallarchaeota archaeon]